MLLLVDQITCAVLADCAGCTQEVDFGRMSVSRSSDTVFESQLEDVVVNLATADCVTLDAAGRLVITTVADDWTVPSEAAIDSPLQNLAIYKQLMATGYLGAAPGIPLPDDVLNTAARGLGAASDKTGEVNVDLVVYLNEILGLSEPGVATAPELGDLICQKNREEVKGAVVLVEKCFLNYEAYAYERAANFLGLPYPPYIPAGDDSPGTRLVRISGRLGPGTSTNVPDRAGPHPGCRVLGYRRFRWPTTSAALRRRQTTRVRSSTTCTTGRCRTRTSTRPS